MEGYRLDHRSVFTAIIIYIHLGVLSYNIILQLQCIILYYRLRGWPDCETTKRDLFAAVRRQTDRRRYTAGDSHRDVWREITIINNDRCCFNPRPWYESGLRESTAPMSIFKNGTTTVNRRLPRAGRYVIVVCRHTYYNNAFYILSNNCYFIFFYYTRLMHTL